MRKLGGTGIRTHDILTSVLLFIATTPSLKDLGLFLYARHDWPFQVASTHGGYLTAVKDS